MHVLLVLVWSSVNLRTSSPTAPGPSPAPRTRCSSANHVAQGVRFRITQRLPYVQGFKSHSESVASDHCTSHWRLLAQSGRTKCPANHCTPRHTNAAPIVCARTNSRLSKASTSTPPSPRTWKKGNGIAEYPCVLDCSSRNRAFDTANSSSSAAAFNLARYNRVCLPLSSVHTPGTHTLLMIVSPRPLVRFTRAATARARTGVPHVTSGVHAGSRGFTRARAGVPHVTGGGSRGFTGFTRARAGVPHVTGGVRGSRGFTGFTRARAGVPHVTGGVHAGACRGPARHRWGSRGRVQRSRTSPARAFIGVHATFRHV